jgi:hypothetical protein
MPRMSIMPDVVDAHCHRATGSFASRLHFLGRDVMLPSVMTGDRDPAHDPNLNTFPVEALKKPHVLSTYTPAFRAIQKQREHERLVSIFLDSSATRLVPKIAFCSFVNAIRANLILAMMATLSSKFLLSIEPGYLSSCTTGASPGPSPILIGPRGDRRGRIGQKFAKVNQWQWLPTGPGKVHCNSLTCQCRMRHHPQPNAVIVENPTRGT